MPAIDDSANVVLHRYRNKEWIIENYSFPASMNGFDDILKYFGFTEHHSNDVTHPDFVEVYSKKEWVKKNASFEYAVILTLFGDHGPLILCDTFIDLLNLLNEVKGYGAIFEREDIVKQLVRVSNEVDHLMSEVNHMRNELGLQLDRIGNLIETGIGTVVKKYVEKICAYLLLLLPKDKMEKVIDEENE